MSAMAIIDESERAELANNGTWLSISILHDLRNPLATIYAAAEVLVGLDLKPTEVKRLRRFGFSLAFISRRRSIKASICG